MSEYKFFFYFDVFYILSSDNSRSTVITTFYLEPVGESLSKLLVMVTDKFPILQTDPVLPSPQPKLVCYQFNSVRDLSLHQNVVFLRHDVEHCRGDVLYVGDTHSAVSVDIVQSEYPADLVIEAPVLQQIQGLGKFLKKCIKYYRIENL